MSRYLYRSYHYINNPRIFTDLLIYLCKFIISKYSNINYTLQNNVG